MTQLHNYSKCYFRFTWVDHGFEDCENQVFLCLMDMIIFGGDHVQCLFLQPISPESVIDEHWKDCLFIIAKWKMECSVSVEGIGYMAHYLTYMTMESRAACENGVSLCMEKFIYLLFPT